MNAKNNFAVSKNWIRVGSETFPKCQITCITKDKRSAFEEGYKTEKHYVKITLYLGKCRIERNLYCDTEDDADDVIYLITEKESFLTIPK